MSRRAETCHAYTASTVWQRRADRYRRGPWWWWFLPGHRNRNHCMACGAPGNPKVDVHHRSYAHAFHGQEPDRDLRGLCRRCHNQVHDLARRGWTLARATDWVIANTLPTRRG